MPYYLHGFAIILELAASGLAIYVGTCAVIMSNVLATTKKVANTVHNDARLASYSQLKVPQDHENVLTFMSGFLLVLGVIVICFGFFLFCDILAMLTLLCRPYSAYNEQLFCSQKLRHSMKMDILDLSIKHKARRMEQRDDGTKRKGSGLVNK